MSQETHVSWLAQLVLARGRRRCPTVQAPAVGAAGVPLRVGADATGVGLPVVDALRAAGVDVTAAYFTGGRRCIAKPGERAVTIGKEWFVSRLQALLHTGRLLLPRTREAQALATELLDYEIKVGARAHAQFGAFKVGAHDDLVCAGGLAVLTVQPSAVAVRREPTAGPRAGLAP